MDNQQPSFKKCVDCGKEKPVTEFYGQGYRLDGTKRYRCRCKICSRPIEAALAKKRYRKNPELYRGYVRKYRNKDPERYRALDRASHRRKKEKVLKAYGGQICACCGEHHFSMLTIDHVNNDGAEHRKKISGGAKNVGSRLYQWLITNKFPPGFQVLCFNCNSSKHINKGICEHKIEEGSTTIPKGSTPKRVEKHSP